MTKRAATIDDSQDGPPSIIVLAGPNGAGKTTVAPRLLKGGLGVMEFLNADLIARGLSPFDPDRAAVAAGEILLRRMDALTEQRTSFGFETTLAARSLAPRFRSQIAAGYEVHLVFLWLASADLAVARVADRVRLGGHDVPETTVRRRYAAGLSNFFRLYLPLATTWRMYDNSYADRRTLIAAGEGDQIRRVGAKRIWRSICRRYQA